MTDIKELKDVELEQVNGGENTDVPNNPKGLKPGDNVFFKNSECGNICMWGKFVSYSELNNEYIIEWDEQTLLSPGGYITVLPAGENYVKPEDIL